MSGLTTSTRKVRRKTSVNENKSRKVGRLRGSCWRSSDVHNIELRELFIHVVKRKKKKNKKILYDYFSAHTQQHRQHHRSGAWNGCKYYMKWHDNIKTAQQKVRFYHSRRKFLSFNPLYNQLVLDFHFPTSFLPTRRVCVCYMVWCVLDQQLCCVLRQRR